ncbi:ABC transporter permease [Nocardiopsis valliformis]|uniref:ABC transporter permease n=1 Tax=Nocardiopsis valliformis TaxID=239974 RepID=UPI0003459097|nr:FtsX-like permease family protein [Nocardiopsis valliformis]
MSLTSAWLGWRSVRHRPGAFIGATIVLVISTVMVSGFSLVYFSAGLQEETVERYAGVPLVVVPEGREGRAPQSLVDDLEALDEVSEAVPEVTFAATLLDPDGTVLTDPDTVWGFGHAWTSARLTPLEVTAGEPPRAEDEIVIDQGLADAGGFTVGQSVDVLVLGEVSDFTISGVAGLANGTDWLHQSALFFSEAYVGGMEDYAPGYVDAVGVYPAGGTGEADLLAAVRSLIAEQGGDRYAALTGDARGPAEGNLSADEDERIALSMLMLVQLAVVCTIGAVASAIGLSVRGRSREIAMLRAIGTTPGQVRLMVTGEAVLLSVAALIIGIPLGATLANLGLDGVSLFRGGLSPAFQVHFTLAGILVSVAAVLFAALAAGLIAAGSALRIRPSEAIAEATTEGPELKRGRIVLGLLAVAAMLLGAAALAVPGVPRETVGQYVSTLLIALAVIASGLLGPRLVGQTAIVLRAAVNRVSRDGPALSVANVAFYHRRFAGIAGPLLLGITLVGAASASQMYNNWHYGMSESQRVTADFVLSSGYGFAERTREEIDALPFVESTVTARLIPIEPQVKAPSPYGDAAMVLRGDAENTLDLDIVEGEYIPEAAGALIMLGSYAERNGIEVGDDLTFAIPGHEREHTFTVSGVVGDASFLNRSVAFGPAAADGIGLRHGAPDGVFLDIVPGTDEDTARAGLEEVFPPGQDGSAFALHDRESMRQVLTEEWAENNRNGTSAFLLMGMFMMFAAVNAISTAQFDRRREFASGRMLGITWRSTYRMVSAEVFMTIALVFAVAVLATLWMAVLITLPTGTDMLSVIPEVIPVAPVAALGGAALLLSVLGALSAVRGVRRTRD